MEPKVDGVENERKKKQKKKKVISKILRTMN